ncbi:MAG: DUF4142 domain-containing protein [Limisphaerales bacterium]
MKFDQKMLAALLAASLCLGGSIYADDHKDKDKDKANEPAGAATEVQSGNTERTDAEIEIDEAAGAETDDLSPEKFAKKAHQSGMAEVAMGQLAAQRAQSSSVKQFGDKLAREHKEANQRLEKIAERRNFELERIIGKKHQETIQNLTSLSGEQFDREFIKHTVEQHRKDIERFEKQASEGEEPAIRSFASETLPMLRQHLKIAETLQTNRHATVPELQEPAGAERPEDQQQQQQQDQPDQLQPDDDGAIQDDAAGADGEVTNNSNP